MKKGNGPIDELGALFTSGIRDLKSTASLVPSSKKLIAAMVEPLDLSEARCVVEFGAGTGNISAALLRGMREDARLLSFEINPRLAVFAGERIRDPRFSLFLRSAEELPAVLREEGFERADAVVSSLGLTLMNDRLRHAILDAAREALSDEGILTQYIYIHGTAVAFRKFDGEFRQFPAKDFFGQRFGEVSRRRVWKNLPPAFVYTCRKPLKRG